jgi:hypothetical protein
MLSDGAESLAQILARHGAADGRADYYGAADVQPPPQTGRGGRGGGANQDPINEVPLNRLPRRKRHTETKTP